MNVEYIQNSPRLMEGAHPHGMPQLSGSLAANPTSSWSVYTKYFPKLAKNAIGEGSENCLENL